MSSTLSVVRDQVPRMAASGIDVEASIDRVSPLVWSGIAMLAAFASLVTAGIVCVRRTQAHRRLMLLASISLLPPAGARIFGPGTPGTAATVLLLVLSLFVYDTWRRGRPDPATWIGGLGLIVFSAVMIGVVAGSELGRAFVLGLR